ncbi:MAG: hypothetical protein JWO53_177 [Chlamydiia bacterium]|nr:hypothetical protein [Chlamydiia bacterium]
MASKWQTSRFFQGMADRIFTILTVLLFCQFPLFIQQYEIRLSGHVLESAKLIQELEKNASSTHKTLPQYIQKFLNNTDPDFQNEGKLLQRILIRYQTLRLSLEALQQATLFTKPFVFIRHLQIDIFTESIASFTPGLSITLESCIYGLVGLLVSSSLVQCTLNLFKKRSE